MVTTKAAAICQVIGVVDTRALELLHGTHESPAEPNSEAGSEDRWRNKLYLDAKRRRMHPEVEGIAEPHWLHVGPTKTSFNVDDKHRSETSLIVRMETYSSASANAKCREGSR